MNRAEEEKYLDTWGDTCLICNEAVDKKDKCLLSAVVPLDKLPDHAASPVTKFYMVCKGCKDKGELV